MKPSFQYRPELLEARVVALTALADAGYTWLSDFGAVDVVHDAFGLEVTGIDDESEAAKILFVLMQTFPEWRYSRLWYVDQNVGEIGWKAVITRDPPKPYERCE